MIDNFGEIPKNKTTSGRLVYSQDRINPFGNYEPGNVQWADLETQARNKKHLQKYYKMFQEKNLKKYWKENLKGTRHVCKRCASKKRCKFFSI